MPQPTERGVYAYGSLPLSFAPALSNAPVGQSCGNCTFYDAGLCHKWDEDVSLIMWCNSWDNVKYLTGESGDVRNDYDS